jgi:hypothetical protein
VKYPIHPEFTLFEFYIVTYSNIRIIRIRFPRFIMSFMHYQNSTKYFHRVCIQSGIVRKKLSFEARCYIIAIYLNVGTLIIDAINVKIQLSPWLTSSFLKITLSNKLNHILFFFSIFSYCKCQFFLHIQM